MIGRNSSSSSVRPVFFTSSVTSFDVTPENEVPTTNAKKYNIFRPAFASFVVALASLVNGLAIGYPATAIPNLNSQPHGSFKMDPYEQSWFGSLYFLGAVPGALLSGWTMDYFGRKATILVSCFPYVIGWVIISAATNVVMMYAGRLLTGFCFALILPIIGVYISEISPPKIRGILMSFHELGLNIGALLMYIIGTFIRWDWCSIICAMVLTVMAFLLFFMPETPRWLIMQNEKEKAIKKLQWIRGKDAIIANEIKDIEESVKDTKEMTPWLNYFKPPLLKCFLVCEFLYILQELSGINVVRQYTVSIFQAAKTNLNPNIETIIVGIVLVAGSVLFTIIVEKRERRVFLLISSMMMAVSLAAMGTYLIIARDYPETAQSTLMWLPLLSMATTCVGYVIGVGPMPYVVTSEVFPNRARGRASSMGVATLCFFGFLITKYFVNLSAAIGESGAFYFCAAICFAGFLIAYFTVPETKGKKLEEIQNELAL
ncbi:Facilitated trehalose transporter Tret1 [Chamberlinius hualienensis]